eukprot:9503830-Pyramimonas_sp.AAC.6
MKTCLGRYLLTSTQSSLSPSFCEFISIGSISLPVIVDREVGDVETAKAKKPAVAWESEHTRVISRLVYTAMSHWSLRCGAQNGTVDALLLRHT